MKGLWKSKLGGGSKYRKQAKKKIKSFENSAVKKYISNKNWDEVLDYRGMKSTVTWDMH